MSVKQLIRVENNRVIAKVPVSYSVGIEVELTSESILQLKQELNDKLSLLNEESKYRKLD